MIVIGHAAAYVRRMVIRSIALFIAGMLCSVGAVAAQEPVAVRPANGLSFRARPYSECRVFILTNSGGYVQIGPGPGVSPWRATVDCGAMVNLSPKNAVGGS